ncbi:MAG: DUF2190 family protein [Heliomarina sp.]|uniref:DUF2190 family protein n=1 Tax=Heliomarina sp. TaxID=2917556 RepID=UPI00405958EE
MKNFIAKGDTVPFTASGDVTSGQGVLSGSLFGVAAGDVADGETGEMNTTGVFELPKVGSQAWTRGVKVYWTPGGNATTTASGNTLIGVAYEVVGSGASETVGQVRLGLVA